MSLGGETGNRTREANSLTRGDATRGQACILETVVEEFGALLIAALASVVGAQSMRLTLRSGVDSHVPLYGGPPVKRCLALLSCLPPILCSAWSTPFFHPGPN